MKQFYSLSLILVICSFIVNAQQVNSHLTLSNSDDIIISEIKADTSGNTTVIGSFYGSLDLDPSLGEAIVESAEPFNPQSFVASYNSDGELRWYLCSDSLEVQFSSRNNQSIHVYEDGTTYLLCQLNGEVDLNPSAEIEQADGIGEVFVLKINSLGEFENYKRLSDSAIVAASFTMDADHNMYLFGNYETVAFDAEAGLGSSTVISNGGRDNFLAKYNSDGDNISTFTFGFGTPYDEYGGNICLDNLGNLIIYGAYNSIFSSSLNMSPDIDNPVVLNDYASRFIAQYTTTDCSLNWAYSFGPNYMITVKDIFVSEIGDIYLAGSFKGNTVTFDLKNPMDTYLQSNYNTESMFFAKYDNEMNYQYAKKVGHGASAPLSADGIYLDADDQLVIFGSFPTITSFNTVMDYDDSFEPLAYKDIFMAKYNSTSGNLAYVDIMPCDFSATYRESCLVDSTFYISGYFAGALDLDADTASSYIIESLSTDYSDMFIANYYNSFRDTTTIDPNQSVYDDIFGESVCVYPNPALDVLNIEIGDVPTNLIINIYSLDGKLVKSESLFQSNYAKIDVEDLHGYYILKIVNDKGRVTTRKQIID